MIIKFIKMIKLCFIYLLLIEKKNPLEKSIINLKIALLILVLPTYLLNSASSIILPLIAWNQQHGLFYAYTL